MRTNGAAVGTQPTTGSIPGPRAHHHDGAGTDHASTPPAGHSASASQRACGARSSGVLTGTHSSRLCGALLAPGSTRSARRRVEHPEPADKRRRIYCLDTHLKLPRTDVLTPWLGLIAYAPTPATGSWVTATHHGSVSPQKRCAIPQVPETSSHIKFSPVGARTGRCRHSEPPVGPERAAQTTCASRTGDAKPCAPAPGARFSF